MCNKIQQILRHFSFSFHWPRNILDMSPGSLRYTPPDFTYPSTTDLWNRDRENICGDLRSAFAHIESTSTSIQKDISL